MRWRSPRKAARPVKWIEDRLEHLLAATSATNRITRIEAAVEADGTVTARRLDQLEDCGAYLRAPEPATLYRNHGNLTGPYRIAHLAVTNRIVVTNKTPTSLNRGFGGPQLYYALERLMQRIAATLDLDPLDVITRNLVPGEALPYRTAAGAIQDSGDFHAAVAHAAAKGGLDALRRKRAAVRAGGRLYGIGHAAAVEPSISDMGYITTVLGAEERRAAGPKDGAVAHATVAVDPLGRRHRHRRLAAAGPGPPHRARPGRGRFARPRPGADYSQSRTRHAEGRLVDRGRKLFEPLLGRGGRRRASGGRAAPGAPGPDREPAAQRAARGAALRRRQSR